MLLGKEHRRHPRVACHFEAEVRSLDQGAAIATRFKELRMSLLKSTVRNVSLGGAFVDAGGAIRKGDIVRMEFSLPGHAPRFAAFGEVCWADKEGSGLRFLALAEDGQVALKDYIHGIMAHSGTLGSN